MEKGMYSKKVYTIEGERVFYAQSQEELEKLVKEFLEEVQNAKT